MEWLSNLLYALGGVLAAITGILLITPAFKSKLLNNPDDPDKFAIFTEIVPGRAKAIMRGGVLVAVLRGEEKPTFSWNLYWYAYEWYVYKLVGLHVIGIPFIHFVHVYDVPRYRVIDENGKKIFVRVQEGDEGFRSDHVRNELSTWYYEFSGADIETIPFTIKGSVQVRITKGSERKALFHTDSWNILLDQALNSVVRDVVRGEVTLDQVIGVTQKGLWDKEVDHGRNAYGRVRGMIEERLFEYTINTADDRHLTLKEIAGIEVERVDIIDFEPELSEEEARGLYAPVMELQAARGRSLAGSGEAEYQEKVLAVLDAHPNHAKENIWAEAHVRAAEHGSLDALVSAVVKKILKS